MNVRTAVGVSDRHLTESAPYEWTYLLTYLLTYKIEQQRQTITKTNSDPQRYTVETHVL